MQQRVFLFMPTYDGRLYIDAAAGFFQASNEDNDIEIRIGMRSGSLLAATFNAGWAEAQDLYASGEIEYFAMQHADVAPPMGWLDAFMHELHASRSDLLAQVLPIKDKRGLTSTAVEDTGDPWAPRRLTQAQVAKLPPTFDSEDVGGPLLCNTGLWLAKLGPWCLDVHFRIQDTIRRLPHEGRLKRFSSVQPEDWDFSRQLHAKGLRLAATSRLTVLHHGDFAFNSDQIWGWEEDLQNDLAARSRKEAKDRAQKTEGEGNDGEGTGQHDSSAAAVAR